MAVSRVSSLRSLVRTMPDNLMWRPFASAAARDPIQQLFLDKINEYKKKSASAPDGLVDADEATQRSVQEERDRVRRQFSIAEGQEDSISVKFSDEKFQLESISQKEWK